MAKFMPPSVGKPVTFRVFSWEMLCAKEWGAQFRAPDRGIYEFSNGRRFDSDDMYYGRGVYGPVPNVTAPVLSLTSIATGNQLTWTAATIAGSTISAYIVYRSTDNLNYSQLAVVQGSADSYFDGFTIQAIASVVDASGDQLVDAYGAALAFLITSAASVSYYVIAESALNSLSAPSNVAQVGAE